LAVLNLIYTRQQQFYYNINRFIHGQGKDPDQANILKDPFECRS